MCLNLTEPQEGATGNTQKYIKFGESSVLEEAFTALLALECLKARIPEVRPHPG